MAQGSQLLGTFLRENGDSPRMKSLSWPLHNLKEDIIHGWLFKNDHEVQNKQKYWPSRQELAMIDGVPITGKI